MMLIYILFYAFMITIAFVVYSGGTPTKDKLPQGKYDETLKGMNDGVKKHFIICGVIIIAAIIPIVDSLRDTVTVRSDTEYGKYEQVSPMLQMNFHTGFGSFFLLVSVLLIITVVIWIIANLNYDKKNRAFLDKLVENYGKYQVEVSELRAKEEEENERVLSSLTAKLGEPVKIIKPLCNLVEKAFIVFPQTQSVYFNTKIIPYDQLVSCEVKDDSYTTVEGKKTAVTKTSTGSTIGRSVVGGLVAGPAGAIIGGSTAKKETEIIDNTKTITHHHYYAVISITETTSPIVKIDCGQSSAKIAEEIKAVVDGIIAKTPKASSKGESVTDELLKLADLKEKGILTEAEFEQQKKRLLT